MNKTASLGREPFLIHRSTQLDLFPIKHFLKGNVLHEHRGWNSLTTSNLSWPALVEYKSTQLLVVALTAVRVMQLMILHYLGTKTSLAMLPSTGYRANSSVFLPVIIPMPSVTHKRKRWSQNLASGYVRRVRRASKETEDVISNAESDLSKPTCPSGYAHFCNEILSSDTKDGGTQDCPELS